MAQSTKTRLLRSSLITALYCIVFGLIFVFGLSTQVHAFYEESGNDNDGYTICFAPTYQVGKTYKLLPGDGMPEVYPENRNFTDNYVATTAHRLCIWTDKDKKVSQETPYWIENGWDTKDDGTPVAHLISPDFQKDLFAVAGEIALRVDPTIDCHFEDGCVGITHDIKISNMLAQHTQSSADDFIKALFSEANSHQKLSGNDSWGHGHHIHEAQEFMCGSNRSEHEQVCNALDWMDGPTCGVQCSENHLRIDWTYTYVDDIKNNDPGAGGGGAGGGGTGTNQTEPTCANSAGSALGWIICPIVDGASAAAEGAYKNFIKPALQLEPQLFNQNNGGYIAWEIMRNFANIGLVIFLLIIIFSQLTSVGIDNYGIKKALPKIIIAAILINLSFFICQLLVDVSNIVGSSLEMLLRSLGSDIYTQMIPPGEINPHIDIPGGVIALANIGETVGGIAILVAVVSKIGTLIAGSGMALLLPILLVALVVVAAIFFFFALLAIRQAGVLILVVLSPLAFACYMLPNTKSLFDKWKKTFTVLLILYPICGLLVGGGHLVSAILVTSGASSGIGWFIVLTGVIVSVAPFFAIPFLVKSSMQAFGKLGGKLAGLTHTGGKLSDKIKGTQGYQNRFTRMAAGNPNGKLGKFRSKFANSKVGRQTGMQRYYQGAQQAAAGLYSDAVSTGVTGIMAATSGDQGALNDHLTTVLNKTAGKRRLSRQDAIDLEAAFVAAGGKPGNESKTIAAMERASTDPIQREAIQSMLNTNSTLGAMVNEHSPMTGRYFSSYVGTGGQNESAYNSNWLSSAEGQKIGRGLKPKHIAKMDADKITEAANAQAINNEQMVATLGTNEMSNVNFTAQRDALRDALARNQYNSPNSSRLQYQDSRGKTWTCTGYNPSTGKSTWS